MRVNRQMICLVLSLACLCSLVSGRTAAQALSSSNLNITSSLSNSELVSDLFVGKGTVGPYILSWKNIEDGSETVTIDGQVLSSKKDYNINYSSGSLTLQSSLPKDKVARVSYKRIIGKSQANSGTSLPINMRLFDRGSGSLDVIGLYSSGDSKNKESGMSVYGLSGGMKLGEGSDISTKFIVDQQSSESGKDAGLSDRSAMQLSAATAFGGLSFKGSFSRAGEQFTSAKEYGFQSAKELTDLSAVFGKQTDVVYASFSYKEQEDLGGNVKGAAQTSGEQKVVLNLENAPKMTISRSTTEKEQSSGTKTGTTIESLQLDKSFGKKTTATAMMQTSEVDNGQTSEETKTTSFGINTTAVDNLQVQSSLTQKDSDKNGEETGFNFSAKAVLGRRLNMDASYLNCDSDAAGTESKTTIGMLVDPFDWLKFQSKLTWKDSDKTGGETGLDLGLKATPGKRLSLNAGYSSTDTDEKGQVSKTDVKVSSKPLDSLDLTAGVSRCDTDNDGQTTTDVSIAARPSDQMKIEGAYSGKQADQGSDEQQRSVKLEAKPTDYMKIAAGLGEKEVDVQLKTSKEAGVELTPSDKLKITSSIKECTDGQQVTTVKDYSGSVKPVDYLEVSGAYKDREDSTAEIADSKSMKLALGASESFKITGQYSYNPEDKKGNIQRLSSSTLGLEMKIGILSITGGYAEKDDYIAGSTQIEREFGLRLPLFGNGKLYTGYKLSEAAAAADLSTETYSVGYTHDLGSRFNLALSGELTRSTQESLSLDEECKATAKLGMKF
ncbi:MAG: hypothetical protein ABFD46_01960 [Armatimonadota bacterium]